MKSVAIVGASLAGIRTAEALRSAGFDGLVTVIGDEPDAPYDRPPLSKQFLDAAFDESRLSLCDVTQLPAQGIGLRLGVAATGLRTGGVGAPNTILLDDGSSLVADGVVIATGTRLRDAPFPVAHPRAFGLRTRADALQVRDALRPDSTVVVVGAGFIGAEIASAAQAKGCTVTVLEAAPTPLARQLGAQMGAACAGLHEQAGVSLRCGVVISEITPNGVVLGDGSVVSTDVVIIGVGVTPNVEWLAGSGLDISNGVLCDETLRARSMIDGSSFDSIVAVGDIARFPHPFETEPIRIEHWTNAVESASHAAATLLGARDAYAPIPYFWSDQFGRKIQFLGRASSFDEVVVVDGSVAEGAWLALYRRGNTLVASLGVSKIRSLMKLRPLIGVEGSWANAVAAFG